MPAVPSPGMSLVAENKTLRRCNSRAHVMQHLVGEIDGLLHRAKMPKTKECVKKQ